MPVYNVSEFEKIDGKFLKSVYLRDGVSDYVVHIFLKEQNAGTNTSTLRFVYTKSVHAAYYITGTYSVISEVNGLLQERTVTVSPPSDVSGFNEEKKLHFLFRTEQIVPHSADGNLKVRLLFWIDGQGTGLPLKTRYDEYKRTGYSYPMPSEEHIDLPRIDRLSGLSLGSSNTLTIGQSSAITINRKADIFTHTLRYEFGTATGTIASNVGASHTWSVPASLANQIPNVASGPGKLHVDTYHGTTKIGTTTTVVNFQVPDSIRPTLTGISLTDLNTKAAQLLGGNNFAQGASNIKITFNGAAGVYGSTIRSYQAEIVSRSQAVTANGASFGTMNWHGTATVRATVTDSRGRTSVSREVIITVLPYQAPFIEFTTARVGSAGTQLMVYRLAGISPLTLNGQQKNTMTVSFEVAEYGSSNYRAVTGAANGTWTSVTSLNNSGALLDGVYAVDKTYTVRGTITDKLQPVPFEAMLRTEDVVQSWSKHGSAFKKVWERGALDVGGDVYIDGKIYVGGQLFSVPSLTQADGRALQASGSWDNITETGFYMGYNLTNSPSLTGMHGWLYMTVIKHNASYVVQQVVDFNGIAIWQRVKHNGSWKPWIAPGLNQFYPVGSIFRSTVNTSPQAGMGGTWQSIGQTTENGNTIYSWKRTS